MSGQYSSRLGSDGPATASVTGLPSAPVSSSPKRAPPGAPSADSRLDPRHAGAAAGPGCSGRRNCNVLLDDLHWDRPDLDCEPQQARGIPRNLQLDETMTMGGWGGVWARCGGNGWVNVVKPPGYSGSREKLKVNDGCAGPGFENG